MLHWWVKTAVEESTRFTLNGAGVGCETPKTVNFTKFADINPTGEYPLPYSYKIFRVCGQFHAL